MLKALLNLFKKKPEVVEEAPYKVEAPVVQEAPAVVEQPKVESTTPAPAKKQYKKPRGRKPNNNTKGKPQAKPQAK